MSSPAQQLFPLIKNAASEYGISIDWICGIIAHESSFNANATNLFGGDLKRGGAWGLMQLTLDTARDYDKDITKDQLLIPDINIDIGCQHLARIKKRWGGQLKTVLCVYNSGRPPERAPHETLDKYVPAVTDKVIKYQKLISSGQLK